MSTYPVLDSKPIDQWKVTELKEELKRRGLPFKGLKDDLIQRLDEALRTETEAAKTFDDNGITEETTAIDDSEKATVGVGESVIRNREIGDPHSATEKTSDTVNESAFRNEETGDVIVESGNKDNFPAGKDDDLGSFGKENGLDEALGGTVSTMVETVSVETKVTVSESMVTDIGFSGEDLENKNEGSNSGLKIKDSKSLQEDLKLELSDVSNQVYEVSKVKSVSVCTDTTIVSTPINETNEQLKDSVIVDDVKPTSSSSENIVVGVEKLQGLDADELLQNEDKNKKVTDVEGTGGDILDMGKKNEVGDVGSGEKLNLERSSGDDSMEEDGLVSKEIDLKFSYSDGCVKTEVDVVKEVGDIGVTVDNLDADKKIVNSENNNGSVVPDVKRKFSGGQDIPVNNESTKRQRRWKSEGLKVVEPARQTTVNHFSPTATPMANKRSFNSSNSVASEESLKERVVPPSSKPSTNSLRIDRFLRPFTLKAVQELLGKTGSVTSFWMDHIKTHCYVTYSSVEEAVETRNAVYNLQWPPNGGRLLVAEFVDPQEVKARVEAPLPSPVTPIIAPLSLPTLATKKPSLAPSPRLLVQRQQLPPPRSFPPLPPPRSFPPLPPPRSFPPLPLPPLSKPPPMREQPLPPPPALPIREQPLPPPPALPTREQPLPPPPALPTREQPLPPPPALPERVEPSVLTLDDLFRKTVATPRIYYLPLSDDQVAEKAKAQ